MKVFSVFILLFCSPVWAQESVSPIPTIERASPGLVGWRASILKPTLAYQVPDRTQTSSISEASGMSVGYMDMEIGDFGWSTSLGFLQGKDSGSNRTPGFVRADVNLGYALNSVLSFRGGFNISEIRNSGLPMRLDPGVGLQLITSLRLYRGFSFDVGYVNMNQGLPETLTLLYQSGLELGLAGTF